MLQDPLYLSLQRNTDSMKNRNKVQNSKTKLKYKGT